MVKSALPEVRPVKGKGKNTPDTSVTNRVTKVRLRPFAEYAPMFNEKHRFLLIEAEELSDRFESAPVHVGAVHIQATIPPPGGTNVGDVAARNVAAAMKAGKKAWQPRLAHINHPNFRWALTAEEIAQVKNARFFELFNGHPGVANDGDGLRVSVERMWDILLTQRLAELKSGVMYGIATDDAHNFLAPDAGKSNPGRGWVMVRAPRLTVRHLFRAMEKGDFYASNGVRLKDVHRSKRDYRVEVDPEPGVEYVIQFIGTRKGYRRDGEPVCDAGGAVLRTTRHYGPDIGEVLAETKGLSASYRWKGDEIYIRARVVSSKPREDAFAADFPSARPPSNNGPFATAWTQPVVTGVR